MAAAMSEPPPSTIGSTANHPGIRVIASLMSGTMLLSQSFMPWQKVVEVRQVIQDKVCSSFEIVHESCILQDHQTLEELGLPPVVAVQVVLLENVVAEVPAEKVESPKPGKLHEWYYRSPPHKRRAMWLIGISVFCVIVAFTIMSISSHWIIIICGCIFLVAAAVASRCAVFTLRSGLT